MPAWLLYVLQIILLTIVVFVVYSLLKQYIFSKIKVNKWIIIGIAVVALILPFVVQLIGVKINSNFVYIQSGIYVVIFLWLFDTLGWGPKKAPAPTKVSKGKNDTTIIRSKAKPNRLKTTDMEVIDISTLKNKKNKKK